MNGGNDRDNQSRNNRDRDNDVTLDYQQQRNQDWYKRQEQDQDDTINSRRNLDNSRRNRGLDDFVDDQSRRNKSKGRDDDEEGKKKSARDRSKGRDNSESPDKKGDTSRRQAVSKDAKVRYIPKTPDQIRRIRERLLQSHVFQALDKEDQNVIIGAMEIKSYRPGEWIIEQGKGGVELYVIDAGEIDCFKVQDIKKDKPSHLKTYKPGESFGENAHLYQARSEAVCFNLDRETFNKIVKDSVLKKRDNFERTVEKMDIFKDLSEINLTQICNKLKEQNVKAGDVILRQGEASTKFYIMQLGRCDANYKSKKVADYKPGDYFGDLELFNKSSIQPSITAKNDCQLLYIDYDSFKKLMGPVETALKRNISSYEKQINQK